MESGAKTEEEPDVSHVEDQVKGVEYSVSDQPEGCEKGKSEEALFKGFLGDVFED